MSKNYPQDSRRAHFIKDYSEQIQEIIQNNLELILDIIKRSKYNNLRSIKNSLCIVDKIINYYLQKKYIPSIDIFRDSYHFSTINILSKIIEFIFCFNLEIKKGLTEEEANQWLELIEKQTESTIIEEYILNTLNTKDSSIQIDKPYIISFLEKYYDYNFWILYDTSFKLRFTFSSIYEFIVDGYFNEQLFDNEITTIIELSSKPEEQFLNNFLNNCYDLSNDEFNKQFSACKKDIQNFKITDFAMLLRLSKRLFEFSNNRLITESSEDIKNMILISFENIYDQNKVIFTKKDYLFLNSLLGNNTDSNLDEIIKKMIEIIEKSKKSEDQKISEQFLMLLDNDLDPDELYSALSKENIKLNYLDMNLLFQKIKLLSNKHIKRFQEAITHKCQGSDIEEIRVSNYDGLVKLSKVIKDYIDGIEKDKDEKPILLSLYLLILLHKELEKIIEKFQSNDN